MQVVKLSNGLTLPLIGLGTNTFGKVNHNWNGEINFETKEIETALKLGYTFLDTAIVYRNEEVVGLAYKKAGVLRNDVFLQTKLPSSHAYIKDEVSIRKALGESLNKFSTSYIDVVLMHQPRPSDEDNLRIYRVLEKMVDEGKINILGVSNFSISQLDYLLKHARIKPAINQIEVHPGYWNEELIAFCQANKVLVQAWSPLFRTSDEYRQQLIDIGNNYNKTWAQVVVRYLIEKGVMVIVKSHDEKRQKENLDVFDFALLEDDRKKIANLNVPNFPRLGILGGTGFVGKALTSEALRIGYQVYNVSLDGKVMPQRHLEIIEVNLLTKHNLDIKLKEVDTLIATLNEKGETYLDLYKEALELAKVLNKPLIIIGTFSNLLDSHGKATLFEGLSEEEQKEEMHRYQLLNLLAKYHMVNWTYVSPSKLVNPNWLHHPYQVGGHIALFDKEGKCEISVIDLVDFALEIASKQKDYNHQQLTIGNR